MKIAQFIDSFYPHVDGVTLVVEHYAKLLHNDKDTCMVIAPAHKGFDDSSFSFPVKRTKSITLKKYGVDFGRPQSDRAFHDFLKEEKFDIFHVHSPFFMGHYAARAAKELGIPVVTTFHSQYRQDFIGISKSKILADILVRKIIKFYRSVDEVWTVNEATAAVLREYGYQSAPRIMENATEYHYPDNPQELIDKVNTQYGLKDKKNVFLYVGQLAEKKNISLSLLAMARLKAQGVPVCMVLVGSGEDKDKLVKLAVDLGLEKETLFTGRIVDRQQLAGLFLRSDLFLFPSIYDTSGLVKIEAATHHLPSLLIRGSAAAQGIKDGENGYLIENNIEDYVMKLRSVLRNKENLKQVGDKAAKTLYQSWDDVIEKVKKGYDDVIDKKRNS